MGAGDMNREIPSSTLATLRGILVSSLSRENLGPHDLPIQENGRHRPLRKVHFHEGTFGFSVERCSVINIYRHSGTVRVSNPLPCTALGILSGGNSSRQTLYDSLMNSGGKLIRDEPRMSLR